MVTALPERERDEEEERQQQREVELLEKYEEGLKFTEMASGATDSGRSGRTSRGWRNSSRRWPPNSKSPRRRTAERRKKIEDLSALNRRLCVDIGRAQFEPVPVREDEFRARQALEQSRRWLLPCVNPEDEREVENYRLRVAFPICQANRRDSILSRCGHPMAGRA